MPLFAGLLLAMTPAASMGLAGTAFAESVEEDADTELPPPEAEDDGDEAARPGEDLEPLEPEPRPVCTNPGWRVSITNYDYRKFYKVEGFSSANRDHSGPAKNFNYEVSKSANLEFSFSTNVGGSAGNALFAKMKSEINAGIKLNLGYGSRYGGNMKVKPRTIGFADSGFLRTIANSRMYLLNSNCERTQHKSVQGRAPWSSHWNTYTRKL